MPPSKMVPFLAMRFSVEGRQGIIQCNGETMEAIMNYLLFLGGGGAADPLAPPPVQPLMHSQYVLVKKISRV